MDLYDAIKQEGNPKVKSMRILLAMIGKFPDEIKGNSAPWCVIDGIAYLTFNFKGGVALIAFYQGIASIQFKGRENNDSSLSLDDLTDLLVAFNEAPEEVKATMVLLLLGDSRETKQFIEFLEDRIR
jgi:hypothetical protein